MRYLLVCGALLCNLQFVIAQQLFFEKYPIDVYHAAVQSWGMDQDKHGVAYIANNDGIITYDGINWDLIKIANQNYVFSLAINATGDLYYGSYNDLGYIKNVSLASRQTHSLKALLPKKFENVKDIGQTVVFKDAVFFSDNINIYMFKNGRFKIFEIQSKWLCKTNNQLFLSTANGLLVYKDGQFKAVGFSNEIAGLKIKRVINYENDKYLFTDETNQVWEFDPHKATGSRLQLFVKDLGLYTKNSVVRTITYLDNGIVAIRSLQGIVFINKEHKVAYFLSKEMLGVDLAGGFTYNDKQHDLWLGTNYCIVHIITSSPLSFFDEKNGLDGSILSLGKKNGYLYAGTGTGLFYKNNSSVFTKIPGLDGESWNFFDFNNTLYLAQANGVFELVGNRAVRLINHRYIQTIGEVRGRPDCLVMGTYNTGIWLLKNTAGIWREQKIKGFEEETRFIQQDADGGFWISHYNKGVYKLRLNADMDSVIGTTLYDTKNGLPSNLNNRIYRLKNGRIIVTTVDGIYDFNKPKNKFEPVEEFREASKGICIYTFTENANGDIYFRGARSSTTETVGAFIKQTNGDFKLQFLTPFNKVMPHTNSLRIDVDVPIMMAGPDEIWIGNGKQIVSYKPSQKTYFNEPLYIFISAVQAGDSLFYNYGGKYPQTEIPFSRNKLRFNYSSSFFEEADKTEYQYKLDGFETKWSSWNTEREAVFTNLPNGNFQFILRGRNIYGKVSQPVFFPFYISAPWYKTWWAYLIYFIFLLYLFYLAVTINAVRIKKQSIALKRMVDIKTIELTNKNHEILEKNHEILAQSKSLKELNLTKDKLFSIISHDLRGPIGQLKQTLDLIDAGDLSMQQLKELIPELSESIGTAFSLTDNLLYWAKSQMEGILIRPVLFDLMEVADENYHLSKQKSDYKHISLINQINKSVNAYSDKDMISLVLRNLITNAIKFTKNGGTVTIGCNVGPGYIEVFVKDTGTGLSAAEVKSIFSRENFHKNGTAGEKGSGLGLMLCQDFIEKNGGKIFVNSEPGKGSTFSFRLYNKDNE